MSLTRTRSAAGLALLAALVAGCGTGLTAYHTARPAAGAQHATSSPAAAAQRSSGMMHAAAEPATAHHHPRPVHHAAAAAPSVNPIPQGNGGDQDADNNGGPSDGDGNI